MHEVNEDLRDDAPSHMCFIEAFVLNLSLEVKAIFFVKLLKDGFGLAPYVLKAKFGHNVAKNIVYDSVRVHLSNVDGDFEGDMGFFDKIPSVSQSTDRGSNNWIRQGDVSPRRTFACVPFCRPIFMIRILGNLLWWPCPSISTSVALPCPLAMRRPLSMAVATAGESAGLM